MAALFAENFLPGTGVQLDRNLIAHGAGRNEDRGFAIKDFGGPGFQAIDGGVFSVHVVADFGGGHGPAHFVAGHGYGVTAQINP